MQADLRLRVSRGGLSPVEDDGDVLAVHTALEIACVHAVTICGEHGESRLFGACRDLLWVPEKAGGRWKSRYRPSKERVAELWLELGGAGYDQSDYQHWPAAAKHLRSFLFISVDDMSEDTARDLVMPQRRIVSTQYDSDGNVTRPERVQIIKQHKHYVEWRSLLSPDDQGHAIDPTYDLDVRPRQVRLRREVILRKRST